MNERPSSLWVLTHRLLKVAAELPHPHAAEVKKLASMLRKAQMPNPNNDAQVQLDSYYLGEHPAHHPVVLLQDTADLRAEQNHARNQRDDSYLDFVKPDPNDLVYASERIARAHPATNKAQSLLRQYAKDKSIVITTRNLKDPNAAIGITFKDLDVFDRVYDILEGLKLEEVLSNKDYSEFG